MELQLCRTIDVAVDAAAFAMPARNTWIAHLDHATALNPSSSTVTLGSSNQVRAALEAIRDVLDVVSLRYYGTTNDFELGSVSGAEKLVTLLELAVACDAGVAVADASVDQDRCRG